jgi:hypothetical protein
MESLWYQKKVTFNETLDFRIIDPIFSKYIPAANPPYHDLDRLYALISKTTFEDSMEILDYSIHMRYDEIRSAERKARKEILKRRGIHSEIHKSMNRELVRDINYRKDILVQILIDRGSDLGAIEDAVSLNLDIDIPRETLIVMIREYDAVIRFYREF